MFRVGFSSSAFTEINENDAKAAVRGWAQTVAKQRNIPTDPDTCILRGVPALRQALRDQLVDAVGVSTMEYAGLRNDIRFNPVFVIHVGRQITERYLLLTRQDGGVNSLADLRGRRLNFHQNIRSCLAQPWLETLLAEQGFQSITNFAGKITQDPKLSKTVLPVFFRQSDACVAPRSGFETMVELNPQLGKQLKVLATSPELVPAVFCFRADYAPAFKEDLLAGLRELHLSPAGQQVLTVFQSERIEEQPMTCLESSLELIAAHEKLASSTSGSPTSAATQPAKSLQETNNPSGPSVSTPKKAGASL